MIFGILIAAIIIVPISIAYYYDYKSDPTQFSTIPSMGKALLKYLLKGGLSLLVLAGLNFIYESIIPFNKNHGFAFNSEREKLGIPKIADHWENREYGCDQYTIIWWDEATTGKHYKKVIEYGIFDIKSETDYYKFKNKNSWETSVWSRYDFETNTIEYFLEKPNENPFTRIASESVKINKLEFEEYISE